MRLNISRLKGLAATLLLSGAAAIFIWLLLPPAWETNDDWIMANMAAGAYGRAESYIPFIHPFLGIILRKAYELIPQLPWMGILWEATVFVSFTGMLWSFRSNLGNRRGILLWGVILVLFGPFFYSTVNFTRVAALAAGAGYLMVFSGLKQKRYFYVVIGLAINWMGYAVRTRSWFMVTALAGGLGVVELFSSMDSFSLHNLTERIKERFQYPAVMAVLFVGCLALNISGQIYKSADPQILQYEEYNSVRAALLDYPMPEYSMVQEEMEKIELSSENYSALKYDFITSDPEVFDIETLEELLTLQKTVRLNLWGVLDSLFKTLVSHQSVINLAAIFLATWLIRGKKNPFLTAWLGIVFLLLNYYLAMLGRNPSRVVDSLSAVTAIYLLWKLEAEKDTIPLKMISIILALSFCLNASTYFLPDQEMQPRMGAEEQTLLDAMEELNETGRYYLCGKTDLKTQIYDLGMEGIENLGANSRQHFLYTGGWWINSPSYMNQLEQAGIMNPYRDILRYDNLLLIDQYKTGLVFSYIRSNYDHPWFPENWSVCDKIMEGLYVIGFNKDITADGPSNDIEWVQAAQIAGSERDLIWFKVLFDGNESLKEKENIYYVQITDREGNTKTYRGEAKQTDAGLELMVGIPREAVTDDTVQLALLRKNLEGRYEETSSVPVEIKNLW